MQPWDIQAALRDARIVASYQPIVRLSDRAAVGLEALARLRHPIHGLVAAERFVPQLERAGLACDLTEHILGAIMRDLSIVDPAIAALRIGINIPLDLLLLPRTLERLESARDAAGMCAGRLVIELTESQPVEDPAALGRTLDRLHAAGYPVLIDDVGPALGYLGALLDLPFAGLKLDGELMRAATHDAGARDSAARIAAAARRRGMVVTAEGVEEQPAWTLARDLGADQAQGFLVAPALAAEDLPAWRAAWDHPAAGAMTG